MVPLNSNTIWVFQQIPREIMEKMMRLEHFEAVTCLAYHDMLSNIQEPETQKKPTFHCILSIYLHWSQDHSQLTIDLDRFQARGNKRLSRMGPRGGGRWNCFSDELIQRDSDHFPAISFPANTFPPSVTFCRDAWCSWREFAIPNVLPNGWLEVGQPQWRM